MSQPNDSDDRMPEDVERQLLALPGEIAPPRDLWKGVAKGIEARIVAKQRSQRLVRRSVAGAGVLLAAAAAIALVLHGSKGGPRLGEPAPVASVPSPALVAPVVSPAPSDPLSAPVVPEEASYRVALAALEPTFQENAKKLPAKDAAAVNVSLDALNKAIGVTRASLAGRPDDSTLRAELDAEYEQKLDAMNEVLAWTTRS